MSNLVSLISKDRVPKEIDGIHVTPVGKISRNKSGAWITLIPTDLTDGRKWDYDLINGKIRTIIARSK